MSCKLIEVGCYDGNSDGNLLQYQYFPSTVPRAFDHRVNHRSPIFSNRPYSTSLPLSLWARASKLEPCMDGGTACPARSSNVGAISSKCIPSTSPRTGRLGEASKKLPNCAWLQSSGPVSFSCK